MILLLAFLFSRMCFDFLLGSLNPKQTATLLRLGGTGSFGATTGAFVGTIIGFFLTRSRVRDGLDVIACSLPIMLTLGRLGCFAAGCCYGIPTQSTSGISYEPGSIAYEDQVVNGLIKRQDTHSLPVYPTQLLEATFGVFLFFPMSYLFRKQIFRGGLFFGYLVVYGLFRFFLEFLRGDTSLGAMNLTVAQIMSIATFTAGMTAILISLRSRKGKKPLMHDY